MCEIVGEVMCGGTRFSQFVGLMYEIVGKVMCEVVDSLVVGQDSPKKMSFYILL